MSTAVWTFISKLILSNNCIPHGFSQDKHVQGDPIFGNHDLFIEKGKLFLKYKHAGARMLTNYYMTYVISTFNSYNFTE